MLTKKDRIRPLHIDKRGSIINVLEGKITSVLLIPSKKGAVRANHYHKKDSHYIYMISGKMRYSARDMRKAHSRKRSVILKSGDLLYTPPMVGHVMEFLEESVFLALTTEKRNQKAYESDTVRIDLL